MLGQLMLSPGGRGKPERERLYGLPVLRARADPEGFFGERRLRRAGRGLGRGGAVRVLVPRGFDRWPLLEEYGLAPVDPSPLVRAQGAALALEALRRQGVDPARATVALRGRRAGWDMERAAALLCPRVRRLVIAAPQGGRELALRLHRKFGLPVLPQEEGGQVGLCFSPGGPAREEAVLELYGPLPRLGGLRLAAPGLDQEDRSDLALLAALWEGGRLGEGDLKIT